MMSLKLWLQKYLVLFSLSYVKGLKMFLWPKYTLALINMQNIEHIQYDVYS